MKKKVVNFDDLYLVPGYSEINTRHSIDLTPRVSDKVAIKTPIIAQDNHLSFKVKPDKMYHQLFLLIVLIQQQDSSR
jgi:hypothetical protein